MREKNQYAEEVGGFINPIRRIKEVMGGIREDYSPSIREWLDKNGEKSIRKLFVARYPIASWINKMFNWITFGKWNQAKKKYGYDEFFHLSLIVEYGDGEKMRLEKNQTIEIHKDVSMKEHEQRLEINVPRIITINEMLNKTEKMMGKSSFFRYDSMKNNCQNFTRALLVSIGLWNSTVKNFLFQDIEELVKEIPSYASKFSRAVTDMAAVADVAISGRGFTNSVGNQNYHMTHRLINTRIAPHHRRETMIKT